MISKYEKIPLEKTWNYSCRKSSWCYLYYYYNIYWINYRISEDFRKINFLNSGYWNSVILIYFGAFVILLFILNKILKKSKYYKSIANFFSGIIEGLTVIFKMKKRNLFIIHSVFIWLMYVLMFWTTSKAFVELYDVTFFQLMISFTLAALSIMFSNGGIGIYPLAVEESLGWYGIQSTTGLAFGWVSWLSQTMMVVIFGGLSLFVLPFINRNKSWQNIYLIFSYLYLRLIH